MSEDEDLLNKIRARRRAAGEPVLDGKFEKVGERPYSDGIDPGVKSPPLCEFGIALRLLKEGHRMTRLGWNGEGQFIELQVPDENSKMTLPYIYITTVQGDRVPWLASQTDMLAMDWHGVPKH